MEEVWNLYLYIIKHFHHKLSSEKPLCLYSNAFWRFRIGNTILLDCLGREQCFLWLEVKTYFLYCYWYRNNVLCNKLFLSWASRLERLKEIILLNTEKNILIGYWTKLLLLTLFIRQKSSSRKKEAWNNNRIYRNSIIKSLHTIWYWNRNGIYRNCII